mgnify:CR=1 FL=1
MSVTTTPSMTPNFSTSVTDYTTTCGGGSVRVSVTPPAGGAASVDGLPASRVRQSRQVLIQPGQRFVVRTTGGVARGYSVRCLPADFPKFAASGLLPSATPFVALSEVSAFVFGGGVAPYAFVVDRHGVPVWWMQTSSLTPFNVTAMAGSRVGFWTGTPFIGGIDDGTFEVHAPNGALEHQVKAVGTATDAHEALRTSRGSWFVSSYVHRDHVDLTSIGGPADGAALDARIEEVSATGDLIWQWNSHDHIATPETAQPIIWQQLPPDPSVYDLVHLNSIFEDGNGGLVVSLRDTNSVVHIRKSDGVIDWKLGGTTTPVSLKVVGDKAVGGPLGGPHDARLSPDGSLTVFDNRIGLKGQPRATRWRINLSKRTATLLEEVPDANVRAAPCCGSARRATDGSWLVDWGANPYVRSYSPSRRLLFSLAFSGHGFAYRASPFGVGAGVRSSFVAGMDAMHPRP